MQEIGATKVNNFASSARVWVKMAKYCLVQPEDLKLVIIHRFYVCSLESNSSGINIALSSWETVNG